MDILIIALLVFVLGAIGGIANALVTQNAFILPHRKGNTFQPGILGNIFVAGIAAVVSWGLYGPFASVPLLGGNTITSPAPILTLGTLVGSITVGFGGARVLSGASDNQLLRQATLRALERAEGSDAETLRKAQDAAPVDLLEIVDELPN